MTKAKTSLILQEAGEIKEYIEKNHKLPLTCTINNVQFSIYSTTYLMSLALKDKFQKKEYKLHSVVRYNTKQHSDTINGEKVKPGDYMKMVDKFLTYCHDHNRVPSYITTIDSKTEVSFELYTYCIAKILVWYRNNKTLPNYCKFNKTDLQNTKTSTQTSKKSTTKSISASKKVVSSVKKTVKKITNCTNPFTSSPHLLTTGEGLGQKYPWDCSAHTVVQEIYKLTGIKLDEDTLIKVGGVTTAGVGHQGINTMIAWFNKKYGFNLKVTWKNFSDLGKTRDERFKAFAELICKPNTAILTHIGYANAGKSKVTDPKKVTGHYEGLDKVNVKTKYVRALNSLGVKINSHAYAGHLQDRTYETQASFFAHTPGNQQALCIITK